MNQQQVIEILSPYWKMSVGQEDRREASSGKFWRELMGLAHVEALGRYAQAQAAELDDAALHIRLLDMARVLKLPARILPNGVLQVGDNLLREHYTHSLSRHGAQRLET